MVAWTRALALLSSQWRSWPFRSSRLEGGDEAAQDRLQAPVDDVAGPEVAGMPQHHREQPDDARRAGLVGEGELKAGEIDLSLFAGWGLEAHLDWQGRGRADTGNGALHGGVGAGEAALPEFTPEAYGGELQVSSSGGRAGRRR